MATNFHLVLLPKNTQKHHKNELIIIVMYTFNCLFPTVSVFNRIKNAMYNVMTEQNRTYVYFDKSIHSSWL